MSEIKDGEIEQHLTLTGAVWGVIFGVNHELFPCYA